MAHLRLSVTMSPDGREATHPKHSLKGHAGCVSGPSRASCVVRRPGVIVVARKYSGRSQINVFDVLALSAIVACGAAGAALLHPTSLRWKIIAFAFGCSIPIAAYQLFWISYRWLYRLPRCRNKRCNASKYTIERSCDDGLYYRRSCGDQYLLTFDEFKFIGRDGEPQPFRRRDSSRGPWLPPAKYRTGSTR